MRQLTIQESERCARDCGYERKLVASYIAMGGKQSYYWIKRGKHPDQLDDPLPLDPYYWFGRLAVRAGKLAWDEYGKVLTMSLGPIYTIHASEYVKAATMQHESIATNDSPWLVLCEVIERLTGEGGSE